MTRLATVPKAAPAVRAQPGRRAEAPTAAAAPALEATRVGRRFGDRVALDDVSIAVAPGEIHALLGPNGAGKTTLMRLFSGLVAPTAGSARVLGLDASRTTLAARRWSGLVPSGDRSFYLRLSGLENLLFFARLGGLRRRAARDRALAALDRVDLLDAARAPVGAYSHGMQKRLSLARALLGEPRVLLVDEATHDLDPEAAANVRAIAERVARDGAAVLWATQRIDEVRGFADRVTLLRGGRVRFAGSVAALIAAAEARRFVLRLGRAPDAPDLALATALGDGAALERLDDDHWLLALRGGTVLGEAVAALATAGVPVHACHRERSEIEAAFVALAAEDAP